MRYLVMAMSILVTLTTSAISSDRKYHSCMGFTPWPSDFTLAAIDQTYQFIRENGNIISHHFDNGVPWQEAYTGMVYPQHLRNEWQERLAKTPNGHRIFISLTPLDFNRENLASYWNNNGEGQPLPKEWINRSFNDPWVMKAYLNYALEAVNIFHPDYLAIGVETNILITHHPEKWDAYLELNAYVYNELKKRYPDLPVFSTVQYEHMRGIEDVSKKNFELQYSGIKRLLRHSDYLALSTYRYGILHPNPPTKNYFDPALSLGKPIVIAESGAMSKTTLVAGTQLISSEESQREFVDMILKKAMQHRFPFVINWVSRDFGPLVSKLPKEAQSIANAWVHTGLVSEKGEEKEAFRIWKSYLSDSLCNQGK